MSKAFKQWYVDTEFDPMAYGAMQASWNAALEHAAKICEAQQEPVNDEPVAWCVAYDDPRMGRIHSNPSMHKPELEALIGRAGNPLVLVPLYTRPQPENTLWQTTAKSLGAEVDNITAEVEFMQGKYEEMLEEWLPQKQRIAALEEAAREARDALQYHTSQTRPIFNTTEAIAKLDAVLGGV